MAVTIMLVYGCKKNCPMTHRAALELVNKHIKPNLETVVKTVNNSFLLHDTVKTVDQVQEFIDKFGIEFTRGSTDRMVVWKDAKTLTEVKYTNGQKHTNQ